MVDVKSIAVALTLEVSASYLLVDLNNGTAQLLAFFSAHAVASALLAWGFHFFLPLRFRQPRMPALLFIFCFTFFIPIFGLIGILGAVIATRIMPSKLRWEPYAEVKAPEYVLSMKESGMGMRISGLKLILMDTDLPSEFRLKSLIALQNMPPRVAGPVLRQLLGDPADDIRLLAYSMIDSQEKSINARIEAERAILDATSDKEKQLAAHRQLAELHWELVYSGLVQGDVRDYALAQARKHTEDALGMTDQDPGLWSLKGRILHAMHDLDGAAQAYRVAVSCGMPEARITPYLAEIAFERREFALVRELIGAGSASHATPTMAPLARYWAGLCRT